MKFAKEGWIFVLPFLFLAGLLFFLGRPGWGTAALVVGLLVLLFFRDPKRSYEGDAGYVLAPADGLVTRIDTIEDPEIGPGRYHRIVTFLSVFDVHVQRVPVGGRGHRLPLQPRAGRWPPSARTPETSTRSTCR